MDRRLFLALTTIGCLFLMLATVIGNRYLRKQEQQAAWTDLVVARVEVPLGTMLYQDHLGIVRIPKTALPERSFTKVSDVIGRMNINTIGPQEPITEYRLASQRSGTGIDQSLPEGYRAITIRADNAADVVGLLWPGARVDLMVMVKPSKRMNTQLTSKTVLQNAVVLATSQSMALPKEQADSARVETVTLLVTPQEAEKVMLASYDAHLNIIVRSFAGKAQ